MSIHHPASGFSADLSTSRQVRAAAHGWASRVLRLFKSWREMRELAQLDERALRDIGLIDADVRAAAHLPFRQDPTALLADRAQARTYRRT